MNRRKQEHNSDTNAIREVQTNDLRNQSIPNQHKNLPNRLITTWPYIGQTNYSPSNTSHLLAAQTLIAGTMMIINRSSLCGRMEYNRMNATMGNKRETTTESIWKTDAKNERRRFIQPVDSFSSSFFQYVSILNKMNESYGGF